MSANPAPLYFTGDAYGPENAAAHRKVMEFLRTASKEEFLASLVHAGICDDRGNLLPPYAEESEKDLGDH